MGNESKILIIDDEEVVLDSCAQILEGSNYHIATAIDGIIGLNLVHDFNPDLVFVDLKMPGISGLAVIEKIREIDPTIVIIVITGYATVSSAVEAMKNGAFDFLPKPFTPDEFRLIAMRGLENRRLIKETIVLRKEKEVLREQFAAIVSHELKAPLSAVQQQLFVLTAELEGKLTDEQENRLARIKSRLDDLLKLIHTWLRVISVDINNIQATFKPISVAPVIYRAVENVQLHATRKDIEILTTLVEPLSSINGDEGTLIETLVNIIENAVKYSRVGSQVKVVAEEKEGNILISVADNGVGIAKEDMPYIFEMFFTGKSDQTGESRSGIGLAISRRILDAHRGSISVDSELGKGSIFIISIPIFKN